MRSNLPRPVNALAPGIRSKQIGALATGTRSSRSRLQLRIAFFAIRGCIRIYVSTAVACLFPIFER